MPYLNCLYLGKYDLLYKGPNCTTTAFRYYIEFETGAASGYGHKVAGVAAASISKVKGVATANIGKVIGVD